MDPNYLLQNSGCTSFHFALMHKAKSMMLLQGTNPFLFCEKNIIKGEAMLEDHGYHGD
jgi:hypothetical protein